MHHHLALIFLATLPNSLPCRLGANFQLWAGLAGRQLSQRAAALEGSLGHCCKTKRCLCLGSKHMLAARCGVEQEGSCWTCLVLSDEQLGGGWLAAAVCASKGTCAPRGAAMHFIHAAHIDTHHQQGSAAEARDA